MATKKTPAKREGLALSAITIEGFKSIRTKRTMPLAALNVVAGANSSGKSSFMQPLLLLKQTLEASYDPGPLLINGSNVRFTELEQFFSTRLGNKAKQPLSITMNLDSGLFVDMDFQIDKAGGLELVSNKTSEWQVTSTKFEIQPSTQLFDFVARGTKEGFVPLRKRCFFELNLRDGAPFFALGSSDSSRVAQILRSAIHVPGLRGQPDRRYQTAAIGSQFPGTFDNYAASVIAEWQEKKDERLGRLGDQLKQLGLTWTVQSKKIDATSVELKVGRTVTGQKGGAKDLVSIADVGFGVSQVLPVLVALLVAKEGQLVYIEQPEIHLHPKAQRALAHVFVDAIKTGAQVVVETHSSLFLRQIQTLIAKGEVDKTLVKLHWVTRDDRGDTDLQTCDLDDAGAYGDWPQDFDETESQAATDYYEAAEAVLFKQ